MDTNLRILHWLLAYHFDKLISIYLDKAYYFRYNLKIIMII